MRNGIVRHLLIAAGFLGLIGLGLSAGAPVARAADLATVEGFLDSLTGNWRGQGIVTVAPGTGEQEVKTLESRLSFERPWLGEKRWTWTEELVRVEDRTSFQQEEAYFLLLNGLHLGHSTPTDAVDVIVASQDELTYHFSWRNPPNREYRREVTLRHAGGGFTLQDKLFLRGDLIEDKTLSYR